MRVYHGSVDVVEKPEIRDADRPLDYGSGFYATTSYEQAEAWVMRRMKDKRIKRGYINIYDFDEKASCCLQQLIFHSPTDEWVDFVMANRIQRGFTHNYDLVYGPVANDRVYVSFTLYEGDIIDREELIERLKTYNLVDQYLFHTTAALQYLKFIEAREVIL